MSFDPQETVVLDCCLIHGFTRGLIWTMRVLRGGVTGVDGNLSSWET
jgi:hypothetical protein